MNGNAEEQFEAKLGALRNDAVACVRYSYTLLAIDSSTEPELCELLNSHALFWNTVRSGLQASAVIALGRIFEHNRGRNGANPTLRFAEEHPGIFSRKSLRDRKLRQGLTEGDAAAYVEDSFEPRQHGFADLRQRLDEMRNLYEGSVRPIRNDVFAHAGQLTVKYRDDLFANLTMRKFERLVVFPLQLWDALFILFSDGREPVVRDAPTLVSEIVAAGVPEYVSTWEHVHAAVSTAAFLESLRPLYPELYQPGI